MYYLEGLNDPVTPRVRLVKDDKLAVLMVDLKKDDDSHNRTLFQKKTFEISGLALEFSRIKNDRGAVEFANKYGLLGVNSKENMVFLDYDYYYLNNFQFEENSAIEFLEEWYWHIQHVNKLFKLLDALQNSKPIEDTHLIIEKSTELYPPSKGIGISSFSNVPMPRLKVQKTYVPPEHHVYWAKDKNPTLLPYLEAKNEKSIEEEYRTYAWLVLEAHIHAIIKKAIFIDFSSIRFDKKAVFGFNYTDRKATKYLLAAIYYDLYRIVNSIDEVISFCSVCSGPFKNKRKGTIFCSNACKQENKRRKSKEGGNKIAKP